MIVGIDIGTQSLKALVLSPEMRVVGEHAVAYRPSFPQAGWAEQQPILWEEALGPAIHGALSKARRKPEDVKALGFAGQLDGCVAIDRQGAPLHPCLIWMDRRADIDGIDAGQVHATCGVVLDATHLAAKIRWLKRNVPAAAARGEIPCAGFLHGVARNGGACHRSCDRFHQHGLWPQDEGL